MSGSEPAATERVAARRLFFALWPDEPQRTALAHAIGKGVRSCGGRPVPPHNLHVTLAFLGSVPESRIAELERIAQTLARQPALAAPRVSFEQLAHWPRPQILVTLGAAVPAAASALAAQLKDATAAAGFRPDLKPFHAHVTVARKVAQALPVQDIEPVSWQFADFALIESRTRPEGPVYSVVACYPLVKHEKARE